MTDPLTDPAAPLPPPDDERAIRRLVAMFSDAAAHGDSDAFCALWADDGHWAIDPPIDADFQGRDAIRDGFAGLIDGWEFLIQFPQYGLLSVDGDEGRGRWLTREVGRFRGGASQQNVALYHDRYARTDGVWRFRERVYRFLLLDDSAVPGVFTKP